MRTLYGFFILSQKFEFEGNEVLVCKEYFFLKILKKQHDQIISKDK